MTGPIAIDLGRRQWKVLQVSRLGKRLRVVEAMTIPIDDYPATWQTPEEYASEDSLSSRMLSRLRKLCPDLRGDACVLVFPEDDCRYETHFEGSESSANSDSDSDPEDFRWALCLSPTPSLTQRIGDGLYLGVRTSSILEWKRALSQFGLALEGVVCPVQLATASHSSSAPEIMASLLDDSQGGRIVIHVSGQPIFTRRLRVTRPRQDGKVLVGASGKLNSWWAIPQRNEAHRCMLGSVSQELRRTFDFVRSKTGQSVMQCVVHGELGTDSAACEQLEEILSVPMISWAFPKHTVLVDGIESNSAVYSLAFAAAMSRWELS